MTETAIVTGASGGIGRACVARLAPDHDVLVHYHSDEAGAETAAATVREAGNDALTHQCDLAVADSVESMVDRTVDELGPVNVLVNNAAVFLERDLETITIEELDRQVAVNLSGTLYCTKAVLPSMREVDRGRIVTVASTAGTHGSPTDPTYAATKGGVIALTRSMAKQYTEQGILSNAVAPGPVATPMQREERRPKLRDDSPIDRLVEPAEVADAIRFFVDTDATSGRVLEIDGGRII